ncbi:UNVERIFIED_CONTAM: hypothetical protein Slati_2884000 [Sesamum latifolium]|uniref:Uncharacterized protein n=1 Tax=Sesamum latifolium TaxID=2727402 RepID=A0AAW2VCI8_9LAMI
MRIKEQKTALSMWGQRTPSEGREWWLELHELKIGVHIEFHTLQPLVEAVQAIMNDFEGKGCRVLICPGVSLALLVAKMNAHLARTCKTENINPPSE